jgi:alkylated DNA nucleotide flippase Atl1
MVSAMAKTAVEKRDGAPPPHVEELAVAEGPMHPAGRMLVPSPLEIQEVACRVPAGRVLRLSDLRAHLATKYRADYTCAMTTGIFLRIVAEAALEERGKAGPGVPYWRVVRDDGEMIDKLPGGVEAQAAKLEADGVDIFRMGARRVVGNVEHYAWVPPPPKRRGRAPEARDGQNDVTARSAKASPSGAPKAAASSRPAGAPSSPRNGASRGPGQGGPRAPQKRR